MNSSEFEKALGAEPRETAARLEREASPDPARRAAVDEALAFEQRLENALRVPVDEEALVESLLAAPKQAHRRFGPPHWLALAASVFILAGVSGLLWVSVQPAGSPSVADYVANHYEHDGAAVLARAGEGTTRDEVQAILTRLGAQASETLVSQIRFIKFCPTPDSRGAHMVLATQDGPATVIFMPAVQVDEPLLLRFDGVSAQVVGLERGAAAIIGASDSAAEDLMTRLQEGVKPLAADA
ncbi:MAG: DUF3379 family protein [Xanthomonadales bacterium]|jgi:hypothetical protein|nr:DUF3379 family protein [Xanthomonadales bacterium]